MALVVKPYQQHFSAYALKEGSVVDQFTTVFGLAQPLIHGDSQTICTRPPVAVNPHLLPCDCLSNKLHSITLVNVYLHTETFAAEILGGY